MLTMDNLNNVKPSVTVTLLYGADVQNTGC